MTGKPFKKTRVVKREARINESDPDRFEKAAKEFLSQKQDYVHGLTVVDKINTKAAIGSSSKKPTYENTDNKTRTNKGGVPGMVEEPGGVRYVPNEKNGPGKILRLFPTRRSTAQKNNKLPNVGWIEEPKSATYEEYIEYLKNQPQIRLRKYRVNPRNGELIEGSEQVLDPFSLNGNPAPDQKIFEEKRLPGLTLGRRGRSLVSRAAAAFGVIADADGKFRCPPGTPAANQFTDSTGSNCFGISAEEITEMAREAAESLSSGRAEKIKNVPAKLFEFLSWLDNGGIPGLGRTVWTDPDGKRIKNIKKWNEARTSQYSRTFVNGMVRAQERLKQQDEVVNELLNALGVDQSDENRLNNQDLFDAFRLLDETGRWQLDMSGRLNPDEVKGLVSQRLQSVSGFSKLPDSRKQSIIDSDVERWYETERAMLEAALDHFIMDPEAAKTIGAIEFERKTDSSVMDEASTSFVVGSESGKFKSVIKIDLPFIMTTQESVIPQLAPNERLKIDVVGARTDAQAANHLTDFLVTVNGHSKQLAAMVERRGLARHIMKHEIFHSVQGQAILQAAQDVIDANGYIDIKFRSGQIKRYQSISEMPSDAIVALMKRPSPQLDITRLNNAVQKMDQVGFLAGEYPKQYFLNPEDYEAEGLSIWLAEASAELAALRDLGIVYGDDIDAALEWQDAYSDGAYALDRVKQLSVKEALEESLPEGGTIPARDIFANSLAEVEKAKGMARKQRIKSLKARVEDTSTPEAEIVDMLAKYRAQLEENKQLYLRGERDGIPTDSPAMRKYAENVDELNEVSRAIEGSWLDRFGLNDKDSKARYRKQLEEKVRQRRFASGTLSEDDSKEYVREMHLDSLREQSLVMDMDDLQEQVVAKNVEMKQPGLSEEQKLEIAEEKNIFMSALKKKVSESGDPREFNSRRREIERRVEAIINPPSEKEEHARRVQEAERIKRATKKQLVSDVKNWVSDPSTTEESVIGRAAISSARRKSLVDQYEKMEKAGIFGDSQEMREIASEIEQATDELKTIERSWASRFGSPNPDKKKEQKKKFSENVKKKQIENGLASDQEVKRSIRQEQISALQSRAESISETSLEDEIVSLEIASIDASVSSDRRKEINEEKNILTSILRRRIVSSDTPEKWSESRKNIRKKVSDIMSPPESRPLKKTKKFRTDRAAESYASEHFTKSSKNMTVSEVNALAELSDTNKTSIARILDPATQDSAISEISIRHSTLRSDGVQIDPTSREQGSVDDQIKNILVPALRAIDKSVIDEDLEMEAIVGLPTESSLKNTDISSVIEHDGLITGSLVTGQSPGSGSTLSNLDGSDVVVGDKKMQRIIIQVEKGKKGTFPTWAFDRDARGSRTEQKLTIPPGSLRIVEIREDGTIVARVSEQKTADQVLDKFGIGSNKSIDANSPDAVKQGAARRAKKSARKAASSDRSNGALNPGRQESDRAKRASKPNRSRVVSSKKTNPEDSPPAANTPSPRRQRSVPVNQNEAAPPVDTEPQSAPSRRRRAGNVSRNDKESGLSSGKAAVSKKNENMAAQEKKAKEAEEYIPKLEEAIKVLEERGEWIGGDLGIVLGMNKNASDESIHSSGNPNNRTADQLAESLPQVIENARIKLDRARKEAELQRFKLESKKKREAQGTLDIEDIPDEVINELENETKMLQSLTPSERQKLVQPDPESEDIAVVHVGASELEGGVLNPGRTVGGLGQDGRLEGAGNTGALNQTSVRNLIRDVEADKRTASILENIADNPSDIFTVSSLEEQRSLSELGIGKFKIGDSINFAGYSTTPEQLRDRMRQVANDIRERAARRERPLRKVQEGGDFGFLSAYALDNYLVSAGYFGRNSMTQIPHNVAEMYTEYEKNQPGKADVIRDPFMRDRWMRSLRGSAYLLIGKKEEDITQQLGPSTESQILGVNKPTFSFSAPTIDPRVIDRVGLALMARAVRLYKEGKEITPEAVIGTSILL